MRTVLLNFTGARKNWGCQATSLGLYRFLAHVLKPFGALDIKTVPYPHSHLKDKWHQKKYGARIARIFADPKPSKQDLLFLESLCRSRFGDYVDVVKNADLVFFQAEGTMGPSKFYRTARVFMLAYLAKKLWDKPVVSLNQSFVVIDDSDLPIAKNIFNAFDLNVFRELKSWEVAQDCGIENVMFSPDFAFVDANSPPDTAPSIVADKYFCVTGSAALNAYDIEAYANTIVQLAEHTQLRPVCLYSRKSDRKLAQEIIAKLGKDRVTVISRDQYQRHYQILPILAKAEFTIGGRYHTAISSLSMKTPVILTAGNSYKNQGIGEMLDMQLPVVKSDQTAEILKLADYYLEHVAQVDESIEAGLNIIHAAHAKFCFALSDWIGSVIKGRPLSASELAGVGAGVILDHPLNLPKITAQKMTEHRYSSIRTQIDLTANLRQCSWGAEIDGS